MIIQQREITLLELTVPSDGLANAKHHKEGKTNYQLILSDHESRGYSVNFTTVGIGALGHWLPHTRLILSSYSP